MSFVWRLYSISWWSKCILLGQYVKYLQYYIMFWGAQLHHPWCCHCNPFVPVKFLQSRYFEYSWCWLCYYRWSYQIKADWIFFIANGMYCMLLFRLVKYSSIIALLTVVLLWLEHIMHALLSLTWNVDVLSPEREPHFPFTLDMSRWIDNWESIGTEISVRVLNLLSVVCFEKKVFEITFDVISSVKLVKLALRGALVKNPSPTITVDLMGPGDPLNLNLCSDRNRIQSCLICWRDQRLVITK